MTTFNWLVLFGVPTIVLAILVWAWTQFKKIMVEGDATKAGVQALLRNSLYHLYNECRHKGYATQSDRQNFENMYKQYHNLGANGVMDDTRKKFLAIKIGDDD